MSNDTTPPRDLRHIPSICQYCGKEYGVGKYVSQRPKQFCSLTCSNKARALVDIPCPICGTMFKPYVNDVDKHRKQYCSQACATKAQVGKSSPKRTPEHAIEYIRLHYPNGDIAEIGAALGLTKKAVQMIATKNGIKRNEQAKQRQYTIVRTYMSDHNPMYQDTTKQKVAAWRATNPDIVAKVQRRLIEGHGRIRRDKPTKLEARLAGYLDTLGIEYEAQAVIKDKFIVDFRIGNIIIQADGDYWHGHPRFEPLTERQQKQRKRDIAQDKYLTTCGYAVIRIWESDMSLDTVRQRLGL